MSAAGTDRVYARHPGGGYVVEWRCEPPAPGEFYLVLSQEWDDAVEPPVRRIFEIQLLRTGTGDDGGD